MVKKYSLPKYTGDLAGFAGILRKQVFSSQAKAAHHFGLNRTTVVRYEREELTPPLGYLACLAQLVMAQLGLEGVNETITHRQTLLQQINEVVQDHYDDIPFKSWNELHSVADEYLTSRQQAHSASTAPIEAENQKVVTSVQIPPLPHYYVERLEVQNTILHIVNQEHIHALALWGPGGVGKSTLAIQLAKTLAANFPDGQIWVELSERLSPNDSISEAQAQIARGFQVRLKGTSLAGRAGELRSLLFDKRCLLVLDNVWTTMDLPYLQVINEKSCLLLTTRYRKSADVLGIPLIQVEGMSFDEGCHLLTKWAGYPVTTPTLVHRLGGLPLALKLCGARLREGDTPDELLAYFRQNGLDLNELNLDDPQEPDEGLEPCFDKNFHHLTSKDQLSFAQLSCFVGRFTVASSAQIWAVDLNEARRRLRRLYSLALVEREANRYGLHPLLRDYAWQKLSRSPAESWAGHRRHAAYYIYHHLYHPQVLDDITAEAPNLDESWADSLAGLKWSIDHAPQLAAIAALLAHTERPALLEAIGESLITAVETYLSETGDETEQLFLRELLGDLYLLSNEFVKALNQFDQVAGLWQLRGNNIFAGRARLRQAGVYLLQQRQPAALEALHRAQAVFAANLPITSLYLEPARWLFYWFDIVYSGLVKGSDLDLLEESIIEFVDLAQKTQQPLLEARAWHIYRLFYTAKQSPDIGENRQKGRTGAARAAWLWRQHGQKDKALAEIMWTQEQTKQRRSLWLVKHFAQRLSRATPNLSQEQIKLISNEKMRRWLEANEAERLKWLLEELPPPGSNNWSPVDDILNIGAAGQQVRRLARGIPRPDKHPVSNPLWKVLTGQRALPLVGEAAIALVKRYRAILETELSS